VLSILAFCGLSQALEPPANADEGPLVELSAQQLAPTLPLTEATVSALRGRSHRQAATGLKSISAQDLRGDQVGDHAFLLAWSLLRAGQATDAVPLLELVGSAEHVPRAYLQLTRAEILVADERLAEAAAALEGFPQDSRLWPRAMLVRASALHEVGATADARGIYESLIARPDPAEGSDRALQVLAQLSGKGSEASYAYERRLWAAYPRTQAGIRAAANLKTYGPYASWQEVGLRGDRLMDASRWQETVDLLARSAGEVPLEASPEACMYWYAQGRSLFKLNRVTEASSVLGPAGRKCMGHDDDRGAKALYLAGKSNERKKAWAEAAQHYKAIAELYPEHTMADDGLALAGIALQEAGDLPGARELWSLQVRSFPEGDLAGEGYWRLAWGAYLEGDTSGAITWAEEATASVPLHVDAQHVRANRYWAARWRAWPDLEHPERLVEDEQLRTEAADLLEDLCRDAPFSYYGQLAASRLKMLAPARHAALQRPEIQGGEVWSVRQAFVDEPAVATALQLFRLGLHKEAMSELDELGLSVMSPSEAGLIIEQRWQAGDWLLAHDAYRSYLRTHPPELLGAQRDQILLLAYPNKYWAEVQAVTPTYSWDARIFHGLVREESNFNREIVSHAGARGLSQLMPSTAKGVARWLGITVSQQQLHDPKTNLKIGSRYFESLVSRYQGDVYLAMAGYNAGEGNVAKWMERFGNLPVDQWVESIPYRETRNYVKRVSRSWQTYHLLYDEGPAFPDMSPYMEQAVPGK
jgi:soluble lytic murein transglycosylase